MRRPGAQRKQGEESCYRDAEAAGALTRAGLNDTRTLAAGGLDEWIVHGLHSEGAWLDLWGVGARLVTDHGEVALSGVHGGEPARDLPSQTAAQEREL